MRHRRAWLGLLLPAGLVLLVGVLAALQYRWLGQVSEAEREQLARTLTLKAREFADEFDRGIGQTYAAFQVDANELSADNAEAFGQRLAQWKRGARFPSILKSIYWVRESAPRAEDTGQRAEGRGQRAEGKGQNLDAPVELMLLEYRDSERRFVSVSWPDELGSIRDRLTPRLASTPSPSQTRAQMVTFGSSVFVDVPAIVVPIAVPAEPIQMTSDRSTEFLKRLTSSEATDILFSVRVGHQSLVLLLDDQEIRQTVLPALAERYFPEIGRDRYRVSIVDGKGTSILNRGLAAGASLDPAKADVATPFFSLRLETARGILPGGHMMWAMPDGPPGPAMPSQTVTARARGSSSLSVFVEQRGTVETGRGGVRVGLPGWRLLLQHADGSLDAAVANARRRNVWLSFGILAVLAAGVSLIVLNAQRSERLAAQQMDFVATVSHELRTPLAVIRSAAQNLSAGVVLDNTQTRRYGDLIEGEGRRLTDMVEQVLEFAGLSSTHKAMQAKAISVAHVVDDAVSASEALIAANDFELVVSVPDDLPLVSGEVPALHRALQNLITNALKHAATGRWLSITATRSSNRGRPEVQIAVSDRGPGIEAGDLPHLFEPFYRGRAALDRQVQGNGLGLSLVKRIAEAYGGRVTVKSTPGEGSTFTLHLPVAQADAAADAAAVDSPSETPRPATP